MRYVAHVKRSPSAGRSSHSTWANRRHVPGYAASERPARSASGAPHGLRRCAAGWKSCAVSDKRAGPGAAGVPRPLPDASVSGLVLRDDRRRDATALAHLVSPLPCPCPDLRAALPAGASTGPAPASGSTCTAGVVGVRAELVMQFLAVRSAHVDLVRSSLKGERNRLLTHDLAIVGKVADDGRCNLSSHGIQPFRCRQSFKVCQTYTKTVASDNSRHRESRHELCRVRE